MLHCCCTNWRKAEWCCRRMILFLLVEDDVNGKLNDRILILISPTNAMISLSEKLLSLIYCYDTLIDQNVFVWMNIYEMICIFLFVADCGLTGNIKCICQFTWGNCTFLTVIIILKMEMDKLKYNYGKKVENDFKPGINYTAVPSTIIRLPAPVTKYFICHNTF